MYFAKGNYVYYYQYKIADAELFLTVHETKDTIIDAEEQAIILANMLNESMT